MEFLKNFIRNLLFLATFFIGLLIFAPDIMSQVYGLLGALFGPVLFLILIVAALPPKRRRR